MPRCRKRQYHDAVVESAGALLFLDPAVAAALDDNELDAHSDADGALRFTLEDLTP